MNNICLFFISKSQILAYLIKWKYTVRNSVGDIDLYRSRAPPHACHRAVHRAVHRAARFLFLDIFFVAV